MQLGLTLEEFEYLDLALAFLETSGLYTEEQFPLLASVRSKIDFMRSIKYITLHR